MTGLPTTSVKLDDGSGTYPIDISTRVELEETVNVSGYGRTDEYDQPQSASLTLVLDNADGAVTGGTSTSLITGNASDFEAGIGAWVGVGSATVAQSTTQAYDGTHSLRATWPTAGSGVARASLSVSGLTVGTTYTLVASVFVPTGAPNAQLMISGGTPAAAITTKNAWVRSSLTFTATATSHSVQVATAAASTAGQFTYIDAVDLYLGYGAIAPGAPGTPIRLTETVGATTRNRFTGNVAALDLGWPGGGQSFATVQVTASDVMADLARRDMLSILKEEILLDSPSAYYTLGEEAGSSGAGDTSGNSGAPLTITGTGAALTFGNDTGLVSTPTTVTFASGQYLTGHSDAGFLGTGSWSFEFVFQTTAISQVLLDLEGSHAVAGDYGFVVSLTGAGRVSLQSNGFASYSFTFAGSVNDGLYHHIAATWDGATASYYLDGALAATEGAANFITELTDVYVGNDQAGDAAFTGSISNLAFYPTALSAARVASQAGVVQDFTETTDARLTRLASYTGLAATTSSPSGQVMGPQATAGSSLFEALQTVVEAEQGVLFVDGGGGLVMQGRYYRTLRTAADLTMGSDEIDSGTSVTWDTQQLINQVTVTRADGATQVVTNGTPTFLYPASLDLVVDSDSTALAIAQWVANKHATTAPRLGSVTFDLQSSANAATLLDMEIGDRLAISSMPSQLWAGAGDYTVEGWTENQSDQEWTLTVNILPWDLFEAALWDDVNSLWDSAVWAI